MPMGFFSNKNVFFNKDRAINHPASIEAYLKDETYTWGVVCAKEPQGASIVAFSKGFLFLNKFAIMECNRPPSIGGLVRMQWKALSDFDAVCGVVTQYVVIPRTYYPANFSPSLQQNTCKGFFGGGYTININCEVQYLRTEEGVSVFFNQFLGEVFDVNFVATEAPMTVFRCTVGHTFDSEFLKMTNSKNYKCAKSDTFTKFWRIISCQWSAPLKMEGPKLGFITRFTENTSVFIWPLDSESKRPVTVSPELMNTFDSKYLGHFVHFYVIPKTRYVCRIVITPQQLPTKREKGMYLVGMECTLSGKLSPYTKVPVLHSKIYSWIEDRNKLSSLMWPGTTASFWCYLDISSTNTHYLDWVVYKPYEVKYGPCKPRNIDGTNCDDVIDTFQSKSFVRKQRNNNNKLKSNNFDASFVYEPTTPTSPQLAEEEIKCSASKDHDEFVSEIRKIFRNIMIRNFIIFHDNAKFSVLLEKLAML